MNISQPRSCAQCGREFPLWKICFTLPSRYARWSIACSFCGARNGYESRMPHAIMIVVALCVIFIGHPGSHYVMGNYFNLDNPAIGPLQKAAAVLVLIALGFVLYGFLMLVYSCFGKLEVIGKRG